MAWLVCVSGDDKGLSSELKDEAMTIGRAQDCDVQLFHSKASRYHCKVVLHRSDLYVEDLNSTNGVKYKGKRLAPGKKVKVKLGERFAIGSDIFEFAESHNQLLEASEEMIKQMNAKSRDGVFEDTYTKTLATEIRKKRKRSGIFSFLFGKD